MKKETHMPKTILGISGSLRQASFNSALLREVKQLVGSAADVEIADIGAIPHYNSELDGDDKPAAASRFIEQVSGADALLIATPEYNYSVPGVLKNAIDWASRPAYKSPLAQKKAGLLGASMSPVGSARAQSHLRQILGGTVTPLFPYPDFLAGAAHTKFDDNGRLVDETTRDYLARYVDDFLRWIE
jgi:chromate reductase